MGDFGEIRSLLHGAEDGADVWGELCQRLDRFDPDALDDMVFPYIEGHTRRWDDAVCVAPRDWVERTLGGDALRFWSIVRKIDLSYGYLDADQVLRLLGSSRLEHVTILDLDSNRVGPAGARVIAGAPALRSLRELGLGFNHLGNEGALALAAADNLQALERLNLSANDLDGRRDTLGRLFSAPWSATMRELDLSKNNLGPGLLRSSDLSDTTLPALERLVLDGNPLGDAGLLALLERGPRTPRLRALELRSTDLRAGTGAALVASGLLEHLEVLDLSRNRDLDGHVFMALLDAGMPRLRELSLAATAIDLDAIRRALLGLDALERITLPLGAFPGAGARYNTSLGQSFEVLEELRAMRPEVTIHMAR